VVVVVLGELRILGVRLATTAPRDDMMCFTKARGHCAAASPAPLVAEVEGEAERIADEAAGAADVEDLGPAVDDNREDAGLSGQTGGRAARFSPTSRKTGLVEARPSRIVRSQSNDSAYALDIPNSKHRGPTPRTFDQGAESPAIAGILESGGF
jgi:hypothetical protein